MSLILKIFRQPFLTKPSLPPVSFVGQTIIVTGANVGLGMHAAAHFANMGATRVIATCRSSSKSARTKVDIDSLIEQNKDAVEVWELDYGSYYSVKAFCERVERELSRLDAVVLNAGVATKTYDLAEGDETSVTVNVISTTLLMARLLPVLRRSKEKQGSEAAMVVVGSGIHVMASFPERNAESIFAAMSSEDTKTMSERYPSTKLLQLFAVKEVAERTRNSKPFVTVNTVSPGFNKTALARDASGLERLVQQVLGSFLAWEPEVGARTLVNAVNVGEVSHGIMLDLNEIESDVVAPWVETEEGKNVQRKLWTELERKLEDISPGCVVGMAK